MAKRGDPGKSVSAEIKKIKTFDGETARLSRFWDERYRDTYHEILENRNETGRHGIISEYITRTFHSGDILDIGCGTGILAELLPTDRFRYTGIDISKEAIQRAQKKMPEKKESFIEIRFEAFQTPLTFDVIVCNEVAYYVDIDLLFKKCRSLLADKGQLIFSLFDFTEGRQLLPAIRKQIAEPLELSLTNVGEKLTWHLITGTPLRG